MQRVCSQMCTLVYKHTCVTYTPAHALVPKTPVPKCMQHSLQKNAHIHILTHICIRIHMHTNTHAHAWHRPHAEALILRPTIYAQICVHIHIHMCINAYIYIYIHTCIYIHIYTSAHIHTYTYIHTHIQNVHMHARKHAWNDSAPANTRGADADAGSPARLFRSTQSYCSKWEIKNLSPTFCRILTILPTYFQLSHQNIYHPPSLNKITYLTTKTKSPTRKHIPQNHPHQ